jgi:hypothetical protein
LHAESSLHDFSFPALYSNLSRGRCLSYIDTEGYPDDLREYSTKFAAQAVVIAKAALGATDWIPEKVY